MSVWSKDDAGIVKMDATPSLSSDVGSRVGVTSDVVREWPQ